MKKVKEFKPNDHFVFFVVDGRSEGYGGPSTMYFMGRAVNNPLGKNKERSTNDILYIG